MHMGTVFKESNIDYSKFINFLKERNITERQLYNDTGLSYSSIHKIKKNGNVYTSTLALLVKIMDYYEPNFEHCIDDVCTYIR